MGDRYSLAITQSGKLFILGYNGDGRLGLNDEINRKTPHLINPSYFVNEKVVKITCGHCHSFAITETGKLFAWGLNHNGQLGLGHYNKVLTPTQINNKWFKGETVIYLSGGCEQSFIVTKSGKLFTFGKNDCGQLGLNDKEDRNVPTQCGKDLFGEENKNKKVYNNLSFEDVVFEFQ